MKPTITYEEIIAAKKNKMIGFVDVRSPKEHSFSTIPGAVNIPVLDDETRATVGILYVNGQVEEAKQYGVDWAASQLPNMYTHYQKLLDQYDELVIFCSRGGMRSNSIFSLLKAMGLPVSRLSGGYKAYRHYINEHLNTELTKAAFITLYGLSGSGKTEILKELSRKGANILDLEGCANHRGSMLGSIGLSEPHSQKAFESLLFEASQGWKEGEVVFTEGESKRIGNVVIPSSLFSAIKEGKKFYIDAPLELRVAQIHRDYVKEDNQKELSDSLGALKAFINEDRVNLFQEQVMSGDVDLVIESLLVSYYDPRYNHHKSQRDLTLVSLDAIETADRILEWQKESEQK
ncbi:tRNA 2-selenouridine synthase [Carnobacterium iners]|uniref:tRNA 2-selenouridine synthase n=1 Tax=Carnobacterium iners TaxID=1073423 RepID=A0A1X7MWW1_9LACT|nr:tRNA 2-selenouridine(34) synthase MnmH [Carnobacterium iners]SEL26552.1 tRNA 2-selenouridine synthase [Carnobacterium iners]SMH28891.1 tRNA 2-selenouridine synthase [Carnobacterium iners]